MKKLFLSLLGLLVMVNISYAVHWELGIVAQNGKSIKIWRNGVYTHNDTMGAHGTATTCGAYTAGFILSVGDDETSSYGQPLESGTTYTIIIDGRAAELTTAHANCDHGDFTILFDGSDFSLENCETPHYWSLSSTVDWLKIDVTVKNSFDEGTVKVDNVEYASGMMFGWMSGDPHTLLAFDLPTYGNYVRVFNTWSGQQNGDSLSLIATPTYTQTYTANFKKEFNTDFRNYGPAGSIGGVVSVNQTQYNSPTGTFSVTQYNTIRGTASTPQTLNGVVYTFANWNGSVYSADYTFTPTDHTTYTANFYAKPEPPTDIYVSGDPGDQVTLVWTDNPNQYVTKYDIYRSPNRFRPYEFAATVNSGIQTWTDQDWQITSGYTDSLVHYRMYSVYNYGSIYDTSDASSPVEAYAKPGGQAKRVQGAIQFVDIKRNTPKEYSIGNYPNPFNPSTTLFYQLVEYSDVSLEIYDMTGRRVETLVHGLRSAGYHAKVWHARDASGRSVASGMYFYRFTARPLSGHKPFITSGKLMMMK